ncbi:hypothetical protein BOH78_3918 [Pichia kudriavzevii]|uniref:Uncharacterized protein n=1 Tax=Pichia kudriavzevii TaxID=4909 RepID=A0A1V2LGS9_PICKU|nr:hypothetical protein BOH78_4571 [Pichia kudriavzevii]ONH72227.1 hypothetical protein BOH78_3918 [Pichia kudriavzevii]
MSLAKLLQRLLCGLWRKLELVMDRRNDCSLSGCSAYWFYLHIFLQALFGIFRIPEAMREHKSRSVGAHHET